MARVDPSLKSRLSKEASRKQCQERGDRSAQSVNQGRFAITNKVTSECSAFVCYEFGTSTKRDRPTSRRPSNVGGATPRPVSRALHRYTCIASQSVAHRWRKLPPDTTSGESQPAFIHLFVLTEGTVSAVTLPALWRSAFGVSIFAPLLKDLPYAGTLKIFQKNNSRDGRRLTNQ